MNFVLSVLGLGLIVKTKFIPKNRKLGFKIYVYLIIGISSAMLYQLIFSTIKLQDNLTGSTIEYKKSEHNLNISISICNSLIKWPKSFTSELDRSGSISYKDKQTNQWLLYQNTDISDVFTWQEDIQSYYMCKSTSFKGEELKIIHNLDPHLGDAIFVHDNNFITGGTSLQLSGNMLTGNKILLLKAQKFQSIEEENVCSNSIEFDSCRDGYIADEFNKTHGCLFINMK